MKNMIRVVLVDPSAPSRQALQKLLSGISTVWLAEVCDTYQAAAKSVTENPPDLTIVVLDSDADQGLALIQSIVRANPSAIVLPASKARDSELILRVIRAGGREFLPLPANVEELLGALGRLRPGDHQAGPATRHGSQVIAITGASGGVGCTTLAVNLATELAKDADHTIALVDFDMLLGAIDSCLDIIPEQTVLEVAVNVDRLDLTLLKRTLIRHASGLYVLPHPVAMEDVSKIDPEALRRVVSLLKAGFNTVVIDTSKALQASDFVAFEMADTILLVVELDLACLRNTARLLQLFRQYEGMLDRVRVVVNRVGSAISEIGVKKAEETLKLPISWQIPNAYKTISLARSKGVTIEAEAPGCRAHQAILKIADAFRFPTAPGSELKRRRSRLAAFFL
jgi:pilus assembly protein CpaE